jgi:hypothetical protein
MEMTPMIKFETGKQYKLHLVDFNIEFVAVLKSISWMSRNVVEFNFSCFLLGREVKAVISLDDLYRYHIQEIKDVIGDLN